MPYIEVTFPSSSKEYLFEVYSDEYDKINIGSEYSITDGYGYNYRGSKVTVTKKSLYPCSNFNNSKIKKVRLKPCSVEDEKGERKFMNNLFGKTFNFGKYRGNNVKFSIKGMAYQTGEGNFVAYDKDSENLIDVSDFIINIDGLLYIVPVAIKDISVGDIICHNNDFVIVKEIEKDGIKVISPTSKEVKVIMPEHNIFGFDYCSKILSPISANLFNTVNEDSPFGNVLPFLMFFDKDEKTSGFEKIMIMNMMNGKSDVDFSNPIYALLLCNNDSKDNFLPLMMINMMNKNSEKE